MIEAITSIIVASDSSKLSKEESLESLYLKGKEVNFGTWVDIYRGKKELNLEIAPTDGDPTIIVKDLTTKLYSRQPLNQYRLYANKIDILGVTPISASITIGMDGIFIQKVDNQLKIEVLFYYKNHKTLYVCNRVEALEKLARDFDAVLTRR